MICDSPVEPVVSCATGAVLSANVSMGTRPPPPPPPPPPPKVEIDRDAPRLLEVSFGEGRLGLGLSDAPGSSRGSSARGSARALLGSQKPILGSPSPQKPMLGSSRVKSSASPSPRPKPKPREIAISREKEIAISRDKEMAISRDKEMQLVEALPANLRVDHLLLGREIRRDRGASAAGGHGILRARRREASRKRQGKALGGSWERGTGNLDEAMA